MATNPVVFRPFRYVERASRVMLWRMRGRWDGIERVPTRLPRADVPVAVGKGVVTVHIPKASIASADQVAHAQPFMSTSAQAARVLRICHASGLRGASALTKQQAASV